MTSIDTVVFDLGGVLVDWNPRYLYRKLIEREEEMEHFLANVCHGEWNEMQDAGRSFADGVKELLVVHPQKETLIRAYFDRWSEMIAGEVPGTADVLREIRANGRHKILALSNWSAETFPIARKKFSFFECFDAILLSGDEKLIKPDTKFFKLLTERYEAEPARSVFIDDVEKNVRAAKDLGFHVIRFESSAQLRSDLKKLGIL